MLCRCLFSLHCSQDGFAQQYNLNLLVKNSEARASVKSFYKLFPNLSSLESGILFIYISTYVRNSYFNELPTSTAAHIRTSHMHHHRRLNDASFGRRKSSHAIMTIFELWNSLWANKIGGYHYKSINIINITILCTCVCGCVDMRLGWWCACCVLSIWNSEKIQNITISCTKYQFLIQWILGIILRCRFRWEHAADAIAPFSLKESLTGVRIY